MASTPEDAEPLRPTEHEWSALPEVHYTQQEGKDLPEAVPVSNLPEAVVVKPDHSTTYYDSSEAELPTTSLSTESVWPAVGWIRRGRNKVIFGVAIAVILAIVAVVVSVVVSQRQG